MCCFQSDSRIFLLLLQRCKHGDRAAVASSRGVLGTNMRINKAPQAIVVYIQFINIPLRLDPIKSVLSNSWYRCYFQFWLPFAFNGYLCTNSNLDLLWRRLTSQYVPVAEPGLLGRYLHGRISPDTGVVNNQRTSWISR